MSIWHKSYSLSAVPICMIPYRLIHILSFIIHLFVLFDGGISLRRIRTIPGFSSDAAQARWHMITEAVGSHSLWKNAIGSEKSPHNKSNKLANVPPGVPQEKHLRFEPKNSILMTSICPEFRRRLRLVLQFLYTKSSTVNSRLTMSANSNKNDYANYTRR